MNGIIAERQGKALFERNGKNKEFEPVVKDNGTLFSIFADKISGKENYGAAYFLYWEQPVDGKVVNDFNKDYNARCVVSPHVIYSTAPQQYRLRTRIDNGKNFYSYHGLLTLGRLSGDQAAASPAKAPVALMRTTWDMIFHAAANRTTIDGHSDNHPIPSSVAPEARWQESDQRGTSKCPRQNRGKSTQC